MAQVIGFVASDCLTRGLRVRWGPMPGPSPEERKGKAGLKAIRLKVYLSESDRWRGEPSYRPIVRLMREVGFPGATVTLGCYGFGEHQRIRSTSVLRLSLDLPVVIEAVAPEEQIRRFVSRWRELGFEGTVAVDEVRVIGSSTWGQ